ncbi:IS5 family transposase, partial [Corallococcus sp. ZKHCc1 1396]
RRKRGGRSNALGRSRGGLSTKIHAVTTTGGKLLHLALTPGQQHESTMAEELLVYAEGDAFIADTRYDAERIRANAQTLGMKPVIHLHPSRKQPPPLDRTLYRLRYRVECFFHDLKRFRAAATRYDKTATCYLAVLHVAFMLLWLC